jgi:hypothetical protein
MRANSEIKAHFRPWRHWRRSIGTIGHQDVDSPYRVDTSGSKKLERMRAACPRLNLTWIQVSCWLILGEEIEQVDRSPDIVQLDLINRKQARDFLHLPFRIYADVPQWVPPLEMDAKRMLDLRRNPFFRHSEAAFFLAYKGDIPVGRIAALNNRHYNDFNHSRTAFFWLFESKDSLEVASGLFEAAFAWARSQGLAQIVGPKGFTPLDGFGLLVKGFEHRPAFGLPYNPAYYAPLIEAQGFTVQAEADSGYLGEGIQFPPRVQEMADLIAKRRGLRIASCSAGCAAGPHPNLHALRGTAPSADR